MCDEIIFCQCLHVLPQATAVRGADIKWFLAGQAAYNPDTDNIVAKPVLVREYA